MWEARATYDDGFEIDKLFSEAINIDEDEQQYLIECWLMEAHEGINWYSVDYVEEA